MMTTGCLLFSNILIFFRLGGNVSLIDGLTVLTNLNEGARGEEKTAQNGFRPNLVSNLFHSFTSHLLKDMCYEVSHVFWIPNLN